MRLKEYCQSIRDWLFGPQLVIKDISELDKLMTPEKKAQAEADFKHFYLDKHPDGVKEVMCGPHDDGECYLKKVDLKDFD